MKKDTKKQKEPQPAWPTSKKLSVYLTWMFFLYFLSLFTYGLTNYYNLLRTEHFELFFEWETNFPLIPEFIIIYASLPFVFFLPFFFLKTAYYHVLGLRFLYNLLICGLFFIIFPTKLGFIREIPEGVFADFFYFLHLGDLPHNLFPSLHISLSATLALTFSRTHPSLALKATIWIWMLLVSVSVLAVHQHHLADIIGGLAVAYGSLYHIKETPGVLKKLEERIYQKLKIWFRQNK